MRLLQFPSDRPERVPDSDPIEDVLRDLRNPRCHWLEIERLCDGPKRQFWREAQLGNVRMYLCPVTDWTDAFITGTVVPALLLNLPNPDDGLPVIQQRIDRYHLGEVELCVAKHPWRARVRVGDPARLDATARPFILSLPHAADSWTDVNEQKDKREREACAALEAKVTRVRTFLRRRPEAWPALENWLTGEHR